MTIFELSKCLLRVVRLYLHSSCKSLKSVLPDPWLQSRQNPKIARTHTFVFCFSVCPIVLLRIQKISNPSLFTGSAESGKTTVLEQVRLLYKQHFTETEYFHRKSWIYHNIFKSIRVLCRAMKMSDLQFADPINMGRAQSIISDEDSHHGMFSPELVEKIKCLWKDKAMQKLYARRSQFNLNDSAS